MFLSTSVHLSSNLSDANLSWINSDMWLRDPCNVQNAIHLELKSLALLRPHILCGGVSDRLPPSSSLRQIVLSLSSFLMMFIRLYFGLCFHLFPSTSITITLFRYSSFLATYFHEVVNIKQFYHSPLSKNPPQCTYYNKENLNIIEVVMYVSTVYVSRVLDRQLLNGWCPHHQNCKLCSRPHSHESLIFCIFGIH